ncbi:serine hydrolase domain-containing protein [Sphingomonas sp. LY54]|uniref:serine hydrolase domain-containing protein n=1 Tax=Sphingomonas sp. LY54 TaxID=3095343 RepID=UPI002D798259|nr:serine hydrolase domain-containing protein [Sphingomonas sp. LY54]WRP29965.1 serine hydrolase domain-containing protein [Sphingomonas sp. LY54]
MNDFPNMPIRVPAGSARSALLAAAVSGLALCAQAVGAAPTAPPLDEQVRRIIDSPAASKAPGCVVGLFQDGKAVTQVAAGHADVANGKPLSADTQFYAASLSKQFTALAAIRLAEQGRLDLDADIRRYIPEFPDYGTAVTARMLMHHSAGLRDWLHLARFAGTSAASLDKKAALDLVLRQSAPNYEPGTRYLYSNSGYLVLAEIVERVAGEPFPRHLERTLLRPLGMTNSFFMDGKRPESALLAHGYVGRAGKYQFRNNYPTISGSGGLITSLADLAKFEAAMAGDSAVISSAARKLRLQPGLLTGGVPATDPAKGLTYAGGVTVGRPDGQLMVRHGGSADGFTGLYVRYPEERRATILLCNQGGLDLDAKARAIDAARGDAAPGAHVLANGEQRTYYLPEVARYYRVEAGEGEIQVGNSATADQFDGSPQRYALSDEGDYRSGQYSVRFLDKGRTLVLSSGRASGVRGSEVGR